MKYRFRTLLIVMALVSLGFGIGTPYYQRYRAICFAHELGASLRYESQVDFAGPHWTNVFRRVQQIHADGGVKDQELREILRRLSEVQMLSFLFYDMNLETAEVIGQLPHLHTLELGCIEVTPQQLNAICKSRSLKTIDFSTPFLDKHFEALGQSQSLQNIRVQQTSIDDVRLRYLINVPHLKDLWIHASDGNVPREAIEELLKRHPKITLRCSGAGKENEEWWTELQKRFPESKIQREQ